MLDKLSLVSRLTNMGQGLIRQTIIKAQKARKIKTKVDVELAVDNADFVDYLITADLTRSEKRRLSRNYRLEHNLTMQEMIYLINRHPYYKKLKNKNVSKRLEKRGKLVTAIIKKKKWTKKELLEFISLRETYNTRKLAEYYGVTIGSVNAIKRRIRLANTLANICAGADRKLFNNLFEKYILLNEKSLFAKAQHIKK